MIKGRTDMKKGMKPGMGGPANSVGMVGSPKMAKGQLNKGMKSLGQDRIMGSMSMKRTKARGELA